MNGETLNRFDLTAASHTEFAVKVNIVRAIGGSIVSGSHIITHGAITFKVMMTEGQLATFQLMRQIPNCEAQFAKTYALVTALGGHIKDGSLTVLNGKMNPTIVLDTAACNLYLEMRKLP